jgi:hypothetical protein
MKIMKIKNVVLTALVAMSMSVVAFAKEPGDSRIVVINQKPGLYKVIYEAAKAERVSIRITDEHGKKLFVETFKSEGFIRSVNFEGMAPGIYTLEISDPTATKTETVTYERPSVQRIARVTETTEKGKYVLAIANTGKEEINVKIFDGENNLVHTEDLVITGNYGVLYNLNQIDGVPSFAVTDNAGNDLIRK